MSHVTMSVESGVATVTLDGPDTRNALNLSTVKELIAVCRVINEDSSIGAAVITGANETFCSGAERPVLARAGEDPAEAARYSELGSVYQSFYQVGQLSVPTVAAARGAAVGAGVNLLLATDLRIVSKDCRVIPGFLRIGIHPGGGHFSLISRLSGRETAAALGQFGEEISGQRAAELGLAWSAVDSEEVLSVATELARRVARDPELARVTVKTMRAELGSPMSWEAAIELERASQMWSLRRRT